MKSKIASFTRTLCASSLTAAALLGGGCASIIHGGPRTITVATKPAGATATIAKEEGETVSVNTTPFTIALEPKKAYFKGQTYKIKLELPGYASTEVFVRPEVSGWYFANLIFGGLIGMLIVDPATGSMYNLTPDKIDQQLSKSQVELIKNGNGFVVVMVSQTTPAERANMVKIN